MSLSFPLVPISLFFLSRILFHNLLPSYVVTQPSGERSMGDGMSSPALCGQPSEYLDLTWTATWPKSSASVSVHDGEDVDIVNKEMKAREADIQEKEHGGDSTQMKPMCCEAQQQILRPTVEGVAHFVTHRLYTYQIGSEKTWRIRRTHARRPAAIIDRPSGVVT